MLQKILSYCMIFFNFKLCIKGWIFLGCESRFKRFQEFLTQALSRKIKLFRLPKKVAQVTHKFINTSLDVLQQTLNN